MSFRAMLDHRVDVVRPVEPTVGDSLADDRETYTEVYLNARCAFWPIQTPITDLGAGETPDGKTGASFEKQIDVQDRDIIVTISGPEAGKRWRVVANRHPGRRFGRGKHHGEFEVVPVSGSLPGYDTTLDEAYS